MENSTIQIWLQAVKKLQLLEFPKIMVALFIYIQILNFNIAV